MSHHWLLLTFTCFGSASLQYINTGGPASDTLLDPLDSTYSLPLISYFNEQSDTDSLQNEEPYRDEPRKRRTAEPRDVKSWLPNMLDADESLYLSNREIAPKVVDRDDNGTEVDKKNFSPWGGKRDPNPFFEHMWTWKRASNLREPTMPKRVRFSPWGGKRSGQMIYKPGNKASKVIYSTSIPELTRIVSNYYPDGHQFNLAKFQFIPGLDKRHPIKILAMSSTDSHTLRDALPFQILDNLPKLFKPGHLYTDLHLKKDGKRKVKFSAWGGKRSPPIIGPIWTPASQDTKEATLKTILLIRNNQEDSKKL